MIIREGPERQKGGITSFDEYSNWMKYHTFGEKEVLGDRYEFKKPGEIKHFTETDRKIVGGTIVQNVTSLAEQYPEITFYYYFSPYSIAYWGTLLENGNLNRQIEAEKYAIEQILKCKNIKLYSFNNFWNITTNLDNYKDDVHYGEWINSEILYMIHDGVGQLTEENYEEYIKKEKEFYSNYNYSTFPADIFKQSLYKCCLRVHPFSHFTFDTGCNICRQSRKLLCKQSHKALKCTG